MKKILGVLLFVAIIWGCTSDNEPEEPVTDPTNVTFERSAMLVNWADNIIIPSYEAFSADMTSLKTAFDVFKVDVNETNLASLRASWLTAYKTWQRVSMFEIGPAETVGLRLNMNIYPSDAQKIEGYIASSNYDFSLSSSRDAKGFPALDYLFNGLDVDDTSIVAKYNNDATLIKYVDAILINMTALSSRVLSEWKSGYRDAFVANDGSSATASVDRMVNDYIFYYEKYLRAGKMGIPLGVFSGSTLPQNVEAFYKKDISNELFLEGLTAVQDFFNGKHYGTSASGESLASYLDVLNTVKDGEDLKKAINNQWNKVRTEVTALSPFLSEIENNAAPTRMLLAYDEVQKGIPLLKVDMVSAMSISIDFVDADGD